MRYTLFAILLLVAPCGAFALTWDFDDGNHPWGWTARESATYTSARGSRDPLQSEVVDGVWRIAPVPGQRPTVSIELAINRRRLGLVRSRIILRLRLTPTVLPSMGNSGWAGPMPRTDARGRAFFNPIPSNGKKSP